MTISVSSVFALALRYRAIGSHWVLPFRILARAISFSRLMEIILPRRVEKPMDRPFDEEWHQVTEDPTSINSEDFNSCGVFIVRFRRVAEGAVKMLRDESGRASRVRT